MRTRVPLPLWMVPAVVVLDGKGTQLGTATGPQLATVRKANDPTTLLAAFDGLAKPQ